MGSFCLTKVAQNVRQISGHRAQRPKNTAIPSQTRKAATNQRPDSDHENGAMCSHKKSRSRSKKTSTPGRPPHQTKLTNRNSGNPHTVVLEKDPLNRPPQNTFPATTLLNTYSLEPWSSHAQKQQTITRENAEQAPHQPQGASSSTSVSKYTTFKMHCDFYRPCAAVLSLGLHGQAEPNMIKERKYTSAINTKKDGNDQVASSSHTLNTRCSCEAASVIAGTRGAQLRQAT
jgi:hypothetical protein